MKSDKKFKRNLIIIVIAIIYIILFITFYTYQIKKEDSSVRSTYVKDTASVLTNEQKEKMEKNALKSNVKMKNSTIVTITVPATLEDDVKKQSEELYSLYDLEKENGILILFSQYEDEIVIKMPKKIEECIDNSDIDKIIQQEKNEYDDGEKILEVQKHVIDFVENEESIRNMLERERIFHYVFLAVVIILILFVFSYVGLISFTMSFIFGAFLYDELRNFILRKVKNDY